MSDRNAEDLPERAGVWEIGIAIALILIGLFMVYKGIGYGTGTVRQMGPGFFPVAVGAGLSVLALGIIVEFRRGGVARLNAPIRPIAFITLALVIFAATVKPFGLIPSTIMLILIGSFADKEMTILRAGLSAVALAALGYCVFILGFGLPITAF